MKFISHKIFTAYCLLNLFFCDAAIANPYLFNKEDILRITPRADDKLVQTLVDNQKLLLDAGITTRIQFAHFFAQVATETWGIRRLDENLNYKKDQLLKVFKKRISEQKASEIVGKPREIANWVYGDRLGNRGRHTDDGWNYRGSGFIQLTGRSNFRERGDDVKLPLETDPELARKPFEGLIAATAYWTANNISDIVASDDIQDERKLEKVRKLVNGSKQGLDVADVWLKKARGVFKITGVSAKEDATLVAAASDQELTRAVINALENLGFLGSSVRQESAEVQEKSVSDALRAYQQSRGLNETGVFDEDTLYSITDPQEWRRDLIEEPINDMSHSPTDPEATVSSDLTSEIIVASLYPEATVAFDLASQTITTDGKSVSNSIRKHLNSEVGTGLINQNTNLSPRELLFFENSKAMYAPYEVMEGRRDEKNKFIPYSIIGEDERIIVQNTTNFPARAIVQILFTSDKNGSLSLCTGALISADTVLTAGHCVHSGTKHGSWYADFVIYPGRNSGAQPFGSCTAKKLFSLDGWANAENSDKAKQYDLGAIKLNCDVGHQTGWFSVDTLNGSEINLPVTVQGYPADKIPAGVQYASTDIIRDIQELNVFYRNDTFGGMSGSPVYSEKTNTIFAIHTSGQHNGEPWHSNNGSTRITTERLRSIIQWISN